MEFLKDKVEIRRENSNVQMLTWFQCLPFILGDTTVFVLHSLVGQHEPRDLGAASQVKVGQLDLVSGHLGQNWMTGGSGRWFL